VRQLAIGKTNVTVLPILFCSADGKRLWVMVKTRLRWPDGAA
jgi:hypothetical protein